MLSGKSACYSPAGKDMNMATAPHDETARLAALRHYRILDTEPEQAFDDLAPWLLKFAERPSRSSASSTPTGNGSRRARESR